MPLDTVKYKGNGHMTYITLSRPRVLNAVNIALEQDIAAALRQFDLDDEAWVAILHGAGQAFCAGAKVKERVQDTNTNQRDLD